MKKYLMFIFLTFFSCQAFSAPKVVLEMLAEKEVAVEEKGKMVVKRVLAETVEPGEIVFYTLSYRNEGDEVAKDVAFKNKVPENTEYISGSASGDNAEITFSVDSGKTFNRPSLLVYEVKGEDGKTVQKQVSPEKYTDIQWVVSEVPSGASGALAFQVKVN